MTTLSARLGRGAADFADAVSPRAKATDERRYVSGTFVSVVLLVCLFSPYGMLPGDLRLDHVFVYAAFAFVLLRRTVAWPPLATALFAATTVAAIGVAANLPLYFDDPMQTYKNLDHYLRGPVVLVVAASMNPGEKHVRRVLGTMVASAVVLALMALAERLLPHDSYIPQLLVDRYGGLIYDIGAYRTLQVNHKALMLIEDRASAVFVTAPSLAFAAIFFMAIGAAPLEKVKRSWRIALLGSAIVAGLASNSKSFIFGVPLLGLLILLDARAHKVRMVAPLLLVAIVLAGATVLANDYGLAWDPLERVGPHEDVLSQVSSGRYSESGSNFAISMRVLLDSPLVGYGATSNPRMGTDADNGFNMYVYHSGIVGTLFVLAGVAAQTVWYYRRRMVSAWAAVGGHVLLLAFSFFFAGAIFHMPRINDILFVILGVAYAILAAAPPRSSPPFPRDNPTPTGDAS